MQKVILINTKEKLDKKLSDIYDHCVRVFKKQERVIEFNTVYGDGSIFLPLTKDQSKFFYNTILETWQDYKTENCSWCENTGKISDGYCEVKCGHCNLEIESYIIK